MGTDGKKNLHLANFTSFETNDYDVNLDLALSILSKCIFDLSNSE